MERANQDVDWWTKWRKVKYRDIIKTALTEKVRERKRGKDLRLRDRETERLTDRQRERQREKDREKDRPNRH